MVPNLRYLDSVDSTNTYVVDHFAGLADGTVVAAGFQTAGRGRRGRAWLSPPGNSIAATMAIKNAGRLFLAGAVVGMAGLRLARELAPQASVYLKWPNDIYAGHRKLAGILCEGAGFSRGKLLGIAAGIGLNLNLSQTELDQLDQPAVSLHVLTGQTWPLMEVLERFSALSAEVYQSYKQNPDGLFRSWKRENRLIGCRLDFSAADGREEISGIFRDILPDGEMLLEMEDGSKRILNCGDVRIRRNSLPH